MFDLIKSILSLKKSSSVVRTETKERLLPARHIPELFAIPSYRKELLYFSTDEPQGQGFRISFSILEDEEIEAELGDNQDPSTIYSELVIRPSQLDEVIPKLPYFPTYYDMLPVQRYHYLSWLADVSAEIDIGYVFVYYYGLERRLVTDSFDAAVDEILILRKYHKNSSFQHYSGSALVHSCLIMKRLDVLKRLYLESDFDYFGNSNLLILYKNNLDLLPDMLIKLAETISGVNRRYLKAKPALYLEVLIETLNSEFDRPSYPFVSKYKWESVQAIPYPIFANVSFSHEFRAPSLPNFLRDEAFQNEMAALFQKVHEAIKVRSKSKRVKE